LSVRQIGPSGYSELGRLEPAVGEHLDGRGRSGERWSGDNPEGDDQSEDQAGRRATKGHPENSCGS
jgi:hypothetical protein